MTFVRAMSRSGIGHRIRNLQPSASTIPQPALRRFTTCRDTDALLQLRRVAELQRRVAAENVKTKKERIISEYPDLRDLLERIYDPEFRTNLSFASLRKHIATSSLPVDPAVDKKTIVQLLEDLASKRYVGNEAKNHVVAFLKANGVTNDCDEGTSTLETFGRLLDRNLVAGFGARMLAAVQWSKGREENMSPAGAQSQPSPGKTTGSTSPKASTRGNRLRVFSVALGKSIDPPFAEVVHSNCKWFVSRKLDGVRVITLLDFRIPSSGDLEIVNVEFRSRAGKPFTSLGKVEEQLRTFARFPKLRDWLERDGRIITQERDADVKRLVLDGEVCVMREKAKGRIDSFSASRPDDGSGAETIWSNSNLEEDFTSTVSEIRRGAPYTIAHPVYFIFDVLDYTAFERAAGPSTFGARVQDMRDLGDWLVSNPEAQKVVRPLAQWEVKDASEIDAMVARAAKEGWEGLILRADKPYKGKRSSDVRKFKQWLDAEYTVVGTDNSRMRLAVDGVYGEYEALANIWIEHKGVRVSVGSGFTAEQRIRLGQHPEQIMGKEVTVEYFSESASSSREGMSLRFPRVKQIWEEGRRTV